MKQFSATFAASLAASALLGHLVGFYAFYGSVIMVIFASGLIAISSLAVVMTAKEMMNKAN
jgi:hypothetical protein